jgi:DNA (cytosine-5)-methyltransferase 1
MALRPRNILSLCAGVGGLELGILLALHCRAEAGRGICYVEREAAAAASLVASMESGWLHPAPVWSDMLTFDARPWRGLVHILASGDPCQDNSVAGKRAGAEGQRFLAPEVVRIADECRPDVIVRENVPGNADGQLEAIVPPLERLGYRVAAGIFSSAETGNTMRRERLIIVAERIGCFGAGWQSIATETKGGRTRGQSGGRGGELAHAPRERRGETRRCSGRSAQRADGSSSPLDGAECAERRSNGEPCGEAGEHPLSRRQEGPVGLRAPGEGLERTESIGRREGKQQMGRGRRHGTIGAAARAA